MSEPGDADAEGAELEAWYEQKSKLMASMLGVEADWVMHAIIPYELGGALDQYYYSSPKTGTAMATKELSTLPEQGSSNDRLTTYELVMFTRRTLIREEANDPNTEFGRIDCRLSAILNTITPYSGQATLNQFETCELPAEHERAGGALLIFDEFARFDIDQATSFGLLAVIEIFRSELEFKQENGGEALIDLLKSEGAYPFADLDRSPVV